jgi:hypothetical protein
VAVRTIPLPTVCVAALRERRERQDAEPELAGSSWNETGFVSATGMAVRWTATT